MVLAPSMQYMACPRFHGYSVSEAGDVVSHRKRIRMHGVRGGSVEHIDPLYVRQLKPQPTLKGYLAVTIIVNGKQRRVGVHQLVADAFIGPCPPGLQVRHFDGVGSNNVPTNLKYGTALENAADRQRHGRYPSGSEHPNSKLTDEQVERLHALRATGAKVEDIAALFSVSKSTIESILYRKSYMSP